MLAENGCGAKERAVFTLDPQWTSLQFKKKKKLLSDVQNRRRADASPKGKARKEKKRLQARETRNVIYFSFLFILF